MSSKTVKAYRTVKQTIKQASILRLTQYAESAQERYQKLMKERYQKLMQMDQEYAEIRKINTAEIEKRFDNRQYHNPFTLAERIKIKRAKRKKTAPDKHSLQKKSALTKITKSKKTTIQIAMETMDRIRVNNKTDNAINHLSRFIADTINHNGLTEITKNTIEIPVIYLSVAIVGSRLKQIQYRSKHTYDIHNNALITALSVLYDTKKIDPYNLYFDTLNNPIKADRALYNTNKLYKQSEYNSYNLVSDLVSECTAKIWDTIQTQLSTQKFVDFLTPYIIPYDTVDIDGMERPVKKWKYKAVNSVRIISDTVKTTIDSYKSTVCISDVLTDRTGLVKCTPLSAVSDTVGDITIDNEMFEIFNSWIKNYNISNQAAEILKLHFLYKMTNEQIAKKYDIETKSIEQTITRAKKTISDSMTADSPQKIKTTIKGKKIIVLYNSFGKRECTYQSVSECARALNVSRSAVQKALKTPKIATCKGYTMDYITI